MDHIRLFTVPMFSRKIVEIERLDRCQNYLVYLGGGGWFGRKRVSYSPFIRELKQQRFCATHVYRK